MVYRFKSLRLRVRVHRAYSVYRVYEAYGV